MSAIPPLITQRALKGGRMNRARVITLMTLAVFVMLGSLMILFFGGFPPWPVTVCFAASHITFCIIVAKVKPYHGPYRPPLVDPDPADWAG